MENILELHQLSKTLQIILSGAGILVCGILTFIISCPLTILVFQKKEY